MTSTDTIGRVEQACTELLADHQPVTFTQIAARSGLGRTTLYRNPSVRALIEEHRQRSTSAATLTGLATDIAALRTALEAIASRVRHHEEQLRKISKRRPS
jgi:nicotinamidase-related amidase